MKIGLRTLKTVLAVFISAIIIRYVFHDIPFFACIGALVAVERTMPSSIQASIIRNAGTIVGGVIGVAIAYISPSNILLVSLGLIPMIYICNTINKRESIVPGGIVYFAVSYLNVTSHDALTYGIRRILGTLLGSLVGLTINYLICKPKKDMY